MKISAISNFALKLMAVSTCAALLAISGCKDSAKGKAGRKFRSDETVSPQKLLSTYKAYIADVEFRGSGGAIRSAAVAVGSAGGSTLLLGNHSRLGLNSSGFYRVYFSGKENLDAKLAATYIAGLDSALILLPQKTSLALPIDIAGPQVLFPGANVAILYLDPNGPVRVCTGSINALGPAGPAHCPKLLIEADPAASFDTAIVFATSGGGLAAIVSPENFRNDGLIEALPAWALLRKDYWQYSGDRYAIRQMLEKIDLPAAEH